MIKDEAEKPADISKILDLALEYNPSLAMRDISTPRMWVHEGCDIDLDIIPTMQQITKKKRGISTFSYFTNAVLASRDRRMLLKKEEENTIPKDEEYYCKIFDWMESKGLPLTEEQERRLSIWKQKSPTRENEA